VVRQHVTIIEDRSGQKNQNPLRKRELANGLADLRAFAGDRLRSEQINAPQCRDGRAGE